MKKLMILVLALSASATASAANSMTQKMLAPVLAYQCQQELKQSSVFKAATWLMSDSSKSQYQDQICGCVSKHAMNDMDSKDVAKALLNEEEKNKLLRKAVFNSLKGCVNQALS